MKPYVSFTVTRSRREPESRAYFRERYEDHLERLIREPGSSVSAERDKVIAVAEGIDHLR